MNEEHIQCTSDKGLINPKHSYFMTPNVFIQPMIYKGKDEAEEALLSNDIHSTTDTPLGLLTNYV